MLPKAISQNHKLAKTLGIGQTITHANLGKFIKNPAKRLFYSAKNSAKANKREFSISVKDIVIPEFCPVFGTRLFWGEKRRSPHAPSLDRIDSTKGYTKDNIVVVCWRANRCKQDITFNELEKMYYFYKSLRYKK